MRCLWCQEKGTCGNYKRVAKFYPLSVTKWTPPSQLEGDLQGCLFLYFRVCKSCLYVWRKNDRMNNNRISTSRFERDFFWLSSWSIFTSRKMSLEMRQLRSFLFRSRIPPKSKTPSKRISATFSLRMGLLSPRIRWIQTFLNPLSRVENSKSATPPIACERGKF